MKREEREKILRERAAAMKAFDLEICGPECVYIAGVDEVGRGPLAGPVVAACVVLPRDFSALGVDDSKKLSEKRREQLYEEITAEALAVGIGQRDNLVIDRINILEATKLSMMDAVTSAQDALRSAVSSESSIEHLLIDALELKDLDIPQTPVVKGDAKSISIAAASIVAKVTRDRMMIEYAKEYPGYGFEKNKGYGTKAHYEGIAARGITPIHRKTFLKGQL